MLPRSIIAVLLFVCLASPGAAQEEPEWVSACDDWDEWDEPGPPFRIHADTYYVGTCGIASILIAGEAGHILIDSGTEAGARHVLNNINLLGFDPRDVKILLHSHEHIDHVGGLAALQAETGAILVSSPEAAPVLRSGQLSEADPQYGMHEAFAQSRVDRIVESGDVVTLGGLSVTALATPGHTRGALSWHWRSCEERSCETIVYADSLSPVSSETYRFSADQDALSAYEEGLEALSRLECGLLVTPHPSASGMRTRLLNGTLSGEGQCAAYAETVRVRLKSRIEREKARE